MKPNLRKKVSEANAVFMISKLIERYPEYVRDISDFQFDRVIGKGGFGEVWLGRDLRTGKFCAIKELQAEKLTPHGVSSFLREINTMVKLRNERFILPFVGYTIDAPYSLITEYVPNGTLYAYTHKKGKKATLSDTLLNINAMCIAYGMMKMHEKCIVHRDLKSLNILMDNNYLPMICDFGTSRNLVENNNRKLTPYTGTITHMAPEILFMRPPQSVKNEIKDQSNDKDKKKDLRDLIDFSKVPLFETYGLSCDVYSFGMVLYEISQGQIPFGISKEHIVSCIQNNTKPQIKKPTPKCLVELMYQCINHNPSKRPTFEEIYNKFRTGEVHFSNSDFNTVSKFAEELEKLGPRNLPPPPANPTIDIPSIIQRMNRQHAKLKKQIDELEEAEKEGDKSNDKDKNNKHNESSENQTQIKLESEDEDESSYLILSDPSNALFMSTLSTFSDKLFNVKSKLNYKKFCKFYSVVARHFKDSSSPIYLAAIIDSFTEIAKCDPSVIEHLEKMRFFSFLPVDPEKVILKSLYDLIFQIFDKKPNLVGHSLFRTLGLLLINTNEQEKALALFKMYALKFEDIDDPYKIFDFLISYASAFLESKNGPDYISIFVYVLMNHAEFKSMRLRRLMNIFAAMCRSHNRLVAIEASKAFAIFYEPSLSEPLIDPSVKVQGEMIVVSDEDVGSSQSSRSSFYQTTDHKSALTALSDGLSSSSTNRDSSFASLKNALYENQRRDVSLSSLFQVNANNNGNSNTKDIHLLLGDNEKTAPVATSLIDQKNNDPQTANSSNVSTDSALGLKPVSSNKLFSERSNFEGENNLSSSQPIVRVPYKAIIRNLMDKQLIRPSLSILKRLNHFPSSRTLFKLLMKNLPQSSGVVLKFVSENSSNAIIASKYTKWMQSPTTISMKIFMLIFIHKEAVQSFFEDENSKKLLATYFTSVLATAKSSEILASVGSVVKRLPIDESFVSLLTELGFFKNLSFIVGRYAEDVQVVQSCLSFLGSVSKVSFSQDFLLFVEPLVRLLALKNESSKPAIVVIAELSRFKELALGFKKMNLVPYYTQLLKTKFKPVAASFLRHVEKFSREEEEKKE